MPEISIIIPVYNKEKYVPNIIKCIRNQSYQNFECIIIDDGSTDDSGIICDEMTKNDNRFIVKHIVNGGVSHARNYAISFASGKYITFVDSDDSIEDNYLEELYNSIQKNDVDVVFSCFEKYWPDIDKTEKVNLPEGKINLKLFLNNFGKLQKDTGIFGYCWGKLIKREIIGDKRFDEKLKLAEDFEFYLKLYPEINTIYFEKKCKYIYTQEAINSWSKLKDSEIDYLSQLYINLRYRDFLINSGVYSDENKRIVDENLSNYVVFSAFHCKIEELRTMLGKLNDIVNKEKIAFSSKGMERKWIFWLVKNNFYTILKITLVCRRKLVKMLRGRNR